MKITRLSWFCTRYEFAPGQNFCTMIWLPFTSLTLRDEFEPATRPITSETQGPAALTTQRARKVRMLPVGAVFAPGGDGGGSGQHQRAALRGVDGVQDHEP